MQLCAVNTAVVDRQSHQRHNSHQHNTIPLTSTISPSILSQESQVQFITKYHHKNQATAISDQIHQVKQEEQAYKSKKEQAS
jgi:hypothetical protein